MDRVALDFKPQWAGPIEGFVVNYINRHLWRVQPMMEFEDLYQDAWLFFYNCCERYPLVTEPRHFMALFSITFANHVRDMATARTKRSQRETTATAIDESGEHNLTELAGEDDQRIEDLEFSILMEQAPQELRQLLATLVNEEVLPSMEKKERARETTNQYLCRLLGLDPAAVDLRSQFENFLLGARRRAVPV